MTRTAAAIGGTDILVCLSCCGAFLPSWLRERPGNEDGQECPAAGKTDKNVCPTREPIFGLRPAAVPYFFSSVYVTGGGTRSLAISLSFASANFLNSGISTAFRPCSPLR